MKNISKSIFCRLDILFYFVDICIYIEIYLYTYTDRGLGVAVLAGHGEVQAEGVAVDDVHVAGLGPAERVDAAGEGLVGAHVHHDARVLAVDRDCKQHN